MSKTQKSYQPKFILGLIFILPFTFNCRKANTGITSICDKTCYDGPLGTEGVGACRAGTPICDENNKVIECQGQVLPNDELCDNVDNNCDGIVDGHDMESSIFEIPEDFPCMVHGECQGSKAVCSAGKWECIYPDTVELGDETKCDLLDNDCDGSVDEDLFANEFCYTGDIGSSGNFPCHPGVMSCFQGEVVCMNQVIPTIERCDDIDNDCNGLTDDIPEEYGTQYDIVMAIDTSASMIQEIDAVLGALGEYVDQFSGSNIRFAIVDIAPDRYRDLEENETPPLVKVRKDFDDIAIIHEELRFLAASGRGDEASLDAPSLVCQSRSTPGLLPLSWRENATGIFLGFTDEPPQTYSEEPITQTRIVDHCLENRVAVYQWSVHGNEFAYATDTTGGRNFELSEDYQQMLNDLNEILLTLCQEED